MILSGVGILAVDSSRTRAYLAALADAQLTPERAIVLAGGAAPDPPPPAVPQFDAAPTALERIEDLGVPRTTLATGDVNAPEVAEEAAGCGCHTLIYSGPGGAILRRRLLGSGPRFLHVHPGRLPELRGSTTVYYDLLMRGMCSASALFLAADIDTGPVLEVRDYPAPEDRLTLDHGHDPYIRADLLVRVLRRYAASGRFEERPQPADGRTYFIAHPVLRHLVVLGARTPDDPDQEAA